MRILVRDEDDNCLRATEVEAIGYDKEKGVIWFCDLNEFYYESEMSEIIADKNIREIYTNDKLDLSFSLFKCMDNDE